ncbi:SRPBCC family protein [Actinokineospora cianjurensis]|uniref:Polyketide cyclase/dehydrase/lipid transport protein n=1 Tax=Actinokineospora cianjurensis TaxID=585224 RepID=A0A421B7Y2_9PSEU|nr:SRPBCC family protein [Actinokineospora cianjurensis]RLK60333.1 polyketide cyclase/dehydrase/lipid transport protein [Actinokineospora cianjurensis]
MSTIIETVDVAVPVSTAYNQWTQFESFPAFMEGVEQIRQVDDRNTHWVTKIGGITREFDATITEQIPDERVAWKSVDGPEHAGVITFHRLNDRETRVTAQMDIDPEGFAENVADKLGIIDRRVKSDLKRFKDFIETQGTESGAWRGDVAAPTQTPPPL